MDAMKQDRRGFLKLFGVSSAAIAVAPSVASSDSSAEIERLVEASPAPIPTAESNLFVDATSFRKIGYHTMDVRDEPLWSQLRVEQNAMQARYALFQEPMGMNVTLSQTNMHIAGALIQPEMYCIKQIGMVFSPKTIPALRSAFIDRYSLELRLGRKSYWRAPLATVFSVADPEGEKGFATLPDAGFATLDIPLIIEAGLYFSLDVIGEPIHPCGKLKAWAVFKGLHAVGIQ